MVTREVYINHENGLHLRPAGLLCEKASAYQSKITMEIDGAEYNMKSMLSVLSARISAPRKGLLKCDGTDEAEALEELVSFLENEK